MSANSGVAAWVQRYNSSLGSDDQAYHAAADSNGNVIVAGRRNNGFTWYDIAVAKYSNTGQPLWTNRFDGPGHAEDRPVAVATDAAGNVVVMGSARTGTSLTTADFVTIKYSSSGSLLWTASYNGPVNNHDSPMSKASLGIASDGSVYVTGESDGSWSPSTLTYDFGTIKYVEISPVEISQLKVSNGLFGFSFTNTPNAPFSVWSATDLGVAAPEWTIQGGLTETAPGYFDFTDSSAATSQQRFYRVSSP